MESIQTQLSKLSSDSRKPYAYFPSEFSVIASMFSREPSRISETFQAVELPPKEHVFFQKNIKAYIRKTCSHELYIILPGSYATSARRSFVNSIVAMLDKNSFDECKPNILTFAGIYTEEMLSFEPKSNPWDFSKISQDFYSRIKFFLSDKYTSIGLVGSSGGANLAFYLQYLDESSERPILNRGVFAMSPIIDAIAAFQALDYSFERTPRKDLLLTGYDLGNLATISAHYLTHGRLPNYVDMIDFFEGSSFEPTILNNHQDFINRFYNDFVEDSLRLIIESTTKQKVSMNELSYENFFYKQGCLSEYNADECAKRLNILTVAQEIKAPVFIYFSKDDPVLSVSEYDSANRQPDVITNTLSQLSAKPNFFIFNPPYGGHVGILLDSQRLNMLSAFFN